ncbi:MAG: hypothetical protein QXT64_00310 [Desulfurococcaceae archaeon]
MPRKRKVIPELERGELTKHLPKKYREKGFFNLPAKIRRQALVKSMKEDGYKTVVSRLTALQVLNKRKNPEVARKAAQDRRWLVEAFGKGG